MIPPGRSGHGERDASARPGPGTAGICGAAARREPGAGAKTTEPGGHTLGRWTADHARLTPAKVAIDERGRRTTYAELDTRAATLAERLLRAGYRRGMRIATLTRNSTDHVVLFFACAKAGLEIGRAHV